MGFLSDASRGDVDNPLEAQTVAGVGDDSKVGKNIFDLAAVVEFYSADELIGQPFTDQGFLEDSGLGVGTIKNSKIGILVSRYFDISYFSYHLPRLVLLVLSFVDFYFFSQRVFGSEIKGNVSAIMFDNLLSGADDSLGRAVVLLEPKDFDFGPIFFEVKNIFEIGASPSINRLAHIPDDAEIAVFFG